MKDIKLLKNPYLILKKRIYKLINSLYIYSLDKKYLPKNYFEENKRAVSDK